MLRPHHIRRIEHHGHPTHPTITNETSPHFAEALVKPHIGRVLAVLDVRGSRVSRWSVMEAVLVLAVTLFIGVPYCIGAAHARIQAVFGLVGHAASEADREKDAIVAVYGR